jgi:predicted small secreted protein
MKKFLSIFVAVLSLNACNTTAGSGLPDSSEAGNAGTMSGVVRDSKGQPIAGATVFAGHTLYYNTNALTTSDAQGRYSFSVQSPAGSWYAGAQLKRLFNNHEYTFDLHPDNSEPFNGTTGAVRNFDWRLTGKKPNGATYGARVGLCTDFFDPELLDWVKDIELKLVPNGALVDGSTGQTISKKVLKTPGGQEGLMDIALGLYTISATYRPTGLPAQDLKIRVRNNGDSSSSVTAYFKQEVGEQLLEVEVSRQ